MSRFTMVIVVALFVPFSALLAQQPPPLEVGQRVRVTAPQLAPGRQVGELLWIDEDSLVLDTRGVRYVVPRRLATRIDASHGRRRHVLAGLAAGATVGVGTAAIALTPHGTCTGSGDYLYICRLITAGSIALGAGLGAVAGVFIRTERWVPLPLGRGQLDRLADALEPGQKVRVRVREGEIVKSTILSVQHDSMAVTLAGESVSLSLEAVDSLWVNEGPNAATTTTRAIIGAAIGAVGVFLTSVPACEQESRTNPAHLCDYSGMTKPQSVVGGAVIGAVVGTLFGLASPNWRLHYTEGREVVARVSFAPQRDGRFALGMSVSF